MRTVIKNATVVTMNDARDILREATVCIEDGRIVDIFSTCSPDRALQRDGEPNDHNVEENVIDAQGDVLLPGLINAHTHLAMSLFRNYGNDVALKEWLEDYIWPLEAHLTREEIVAGAKLSILEMLRGGTTTFADMYMEEDAIAEAVTQMGIRALLCPAFTDGSVATRPGEVRRLAAYQTANGRIRMRLAPHAVYTCSPETLQKVKALGEKWGIGFHLHLAETREEDEQCRKTYGISPTMLLDRAGLLGPNTMLAHAIWLDDDDIACITARGASCVYNPVSNMKLASGFMPLGKLRQAGVPIALGTDGPSSNNAQDMFREMLVGSLIQKGHSLDPTAANAHTMLWMATRGGARAIGQEKELGSIEIGKKADLILVDFRHVRHTPKPEDIEEALVYATSSDDVRLTMIDGIIRMQDGRFPGQNEEAICQEAERAWRTLHKQKGQRA